MAMGVPESPPALSFSPDLARANCLSSRPMDRASSSPFDGRLDIFYFLRRRASARATPLGSLPSKTNFHDGRNSRQVALWLFSPFLILTLVPPRSFFFFSYFLVKFAGLFSYVVGTPARIKAAALTFFFPYILHIPYAGSSPFSSFFFAAI